jgi:hypothetical protein
MSISGAAVRNIPTPIFFTRSTTSDKSMLKNKEKSERLTLNAQLDMSPKISQDRMAAAEIANHRKFQLISHDCLKGYFRKKS